MMWSRNGIKTRIVPRKVKLYFAKKKKKKKTQLAIFMSARWLQMITRSYQTCLVFICSCWSYIDYNRQKFESFCLWDKKWKSLRLDLLEVDRMTALIHYEHQRWKKVNFFAKKPLPRSFFQHVQTLCMPSFIDLHTHATPGHVTSFVCSRNTSDRSPAKIYARDRSRSRWNMKHFRQTANRTRLLAAPVDLLPVLAVDLLA